MSELERLFNKKKELVRETLAVGTALDKLIEKKWGFHYSATDDDSIIDTLDYGIAGMQFKGFVETMNDYKEKKAMIESKGEHCKY